MKKFLIVTTIALSLASAPNAFAQFNVNWGTSLDDGNAGYTDLGTWFTNNGYTPNQAAGETLAKTGYIGYNASDADPFYWNPTPAGTFGVVQRMAGNADLTTFGYYTGTGNSKSLTQVLGPGQNGSATVSISDPFGLYINTPTTYRGTTTTNFFTDNSANGGDPQALIYSLGNNQWLIAWEDLKYSGGSDRDFNDAYLKLTVTPEPMSMILMLLGACVLFIITGLHRRKTS